MAAATKTKKKATTAKAKPAPEVEPEEELETEDEVELEEDADELDELEEDEVAETAPTKKGKSKVNADITFGIQDLVTLVTTETGKSTDARGLRTLIRKMARDESGRVEREITQGNRSRYNWTGPNDPEVRAIVDAFAGGELDVEKKAKLDKLKADKAAKTAAAKESGEPLPTKKKKSKKTVSGVTRKKAAAPVEEVEDDEDLEFDDED